MLLKLRIETLETCSIYHNKQKAFNNHGSKTVNFGVMRCLVHNKPAALLPRDIKFTSVKSKTKR